MSEPVAIVGMACRFPGAGSLGEYWNLIRAGRVATAPVSPQRWRHAWLHAAGDPRAADFAYTDIVAHLPDVDSFPVEQYALAPRRLEVTDPQHRLMIVLADDALRDAGLTAIPSRRTDVYIGASAAEYRDLLSTRLRARQMAAGEFGAPLDPDAALAAVAGIAPPRSYTMPGTLLNMAAAAVSSAFDLGGASLVVDAACASALLALHEAVMHLRAGHCDLAIAGGVYLNLVPDNLVAFSRIGAVSPRGVCRPFDRRADGFVLGEGAGVVVLRRLADAIAAGDGAYAVIRGVGCSNDGRAEGPMTPRLEGQVASLRRAYDDAGVSPATVGFVECHGTATRSGDAVELAALREVLGPDASALVSSVKANIGHTMSAAGIAGLIKAALVLRHGTVPPQADCDEPDPALGTFRVSRAAQPWTVPGDTPRRAGVSSFGFGGTNVHVVLEDAPGPARHPASPPPAPRAETARYWAVRQGTPPLAPRVVSSPLLAAVAGVSAHAPDSLRPDRALVDDLGFDSLMLLELEERLARTYPDLGRLPEDLMRRTTTIADLDAWLASRHERPRDDGTDPFPEVAALAERLLLPGRLGIPNPYFVAHDGPLGATTRVGGTVLLDFSGFDYLGLASHPAVAAAATEAIARYGTSMSASRLASGERPLHRELEASIAGLLGAEAALTLVSGHATNLGVIGQLLRRGDLALHDELAHDSKALASCGGYVAGQARLIEYLRYTTPGFVYSVGLPPAAAGAALAALGRLRSEPERVARLRSNTELFRRRASEAGLDVGPGPAPVVPILTGTSASALLLADRMRRRGVNVQPIVYPAVPDAAARLRFFLNASHTDAHIDEAVTILAEEIDGPAPACGSFS